MNISSHLITSNASQVNVWLLRVYCRVFNKTKATKSVFLYLIFLYLHYTAKLIIYSIILLLCGIQISPKILVLDNFHLFLYIEKLWTKKIVTSNAYLLVGYYCEHLCIFTVIGGQNSTKAAFNSLINNRRNQKHHKIWTHQTILKYIEVMDYY